MEKEAFVAKSRLKSSKPDVVKTSSISKPLILSKSSSKSGKHAKPPRVAKQGIAQMAKKHVSEGSKTLNLEVEDDEQVATADALQDSEEAAKKTFLPTGG